MELKVGDYVRFKDKRGNTYIRKVIDGYKAHWYGCRVDKEANNVPYVSTRNIIKSSPNIIDLIEVGDYVNGYKVIDIIKGLKIIIDKLELDTTTGLYHNIGITNIKSIVTKEQFESCMYKVGE